MANSSSLRRHPIRKTDGYSGNPGYDTLDDDEEDNLKGETDEEEEEFNKEDLRVDSVPESNIIKGLYPVLPDRILTGKIKLPATESEEVVSKNKIYYFVFFCVLILVIICVHNNMQTTEIGNENTSEVIVKTLEERFDNQPKLSLKIIRLALGKVLDVQNGGQPSHPAILLLLSSKGAMDVTTCFAKNVAKLASPPDKKGYERIKGSDLKYTDADQAKKIIDDSINNALQNKGQHVVLIENLDLIPAGAVMMLHSYCDHENAPFKNAVFIMTIDGSEDIPLDADSKEFDKVALARLTTMWGEDLHTDQLSALLSRITVSVAPVFPSAQFSYCNA